MEKIMSMNDYKESLIKNNKRKSYNSYPGKRNRRIGSSKKSRRKNANKNFYLSHSIDEPRHIKDYDDNNKLLREVEFIVFETGVSKFRAMKELENTSLDVIQALINIKKEQQLL